MENEKTSIRKKRIIVIIGVLLFLALTAVVGIYIGKPMIQFIDDHEKFHNWVTENGFTAMLAFVGMMALQIVIALLPGEPLELAAGYAFGSVLGTVLCILGAVIGSTAVFLFVRKFGMKAVTLFFDEQKINKLKFLKNSERRDFIIFIIFLIPGTPKDILGYFVGLTDMKLSTWLLITTVGRIPSVITSTVTADAIGMKNYVFAAVAFGVTLIISIGGILIYKAIIKRHNKEDNSDEKSA